MAKITRNKVSKEAIKNKAKTTKWWTKTKIIIVSIIGVLAVAAAVVGTVLHFVLADDETTTHDYFVSAKNSNDETVEFKKASYRGLEMHIDSTTDLFQEYVIVFMYDSTNFYPNQEDDSDNYNKIHSDILLRMANLQTDVNAIKNNTALEIDIDLYVVDLSVGENASIMADSSFLGSYASESEDSTTSYDPAIVLLSSGEIVETFEDENRIKTIIGSDLAGVCNTALPNLSTYVRKLATPAN